MAKRTRYTGRPAGRRPAAKPSGSIAGRTVAPPPVTPSRASAGLTDEELARAAALEAEIAERERAAAAAVARRKAIATGAEAPLAGDVNAPLAVRMAHEYGYVARDVRRIVVTGGLMLAILAVLAILVNVLHVITL
jgi:hypothetical protein